MERNKKETQHNIHMKRLSVNRSIISNYNTGNNNNQMSNINKSVDLSVAKDYRGLGNAGGSKVNLGAATLIGNQNGVTLPKNHKGGLIAPASVINQKQKVGGLG